jgi:hypothetical protein
MDDRPLKLAFIVGHGAAEFNAPYRLTWQRDRDSRGDRTNKALCQTARKTIDFAFSLRYLHESL